MLDCRETQCTATHMQVKTTHFYLCDPSVITGCPLSIDATDVLREVSNLTRLQPPPCRSSLDEQPTLARLALPQLSDCNQGQKKINFQLRILCFGLVMLASDCQNINVNRHASSSPG